MLMIDASAVFPTPETIYLSDLLNPSMSPRNFQNLSILFTDGKVKKHGQKFLNSLNLVKEIPQTCKGKIEASNQSNIQYMIEVV